MATKSLGQQYPWQLALFRLSLFTESAAIYEPHDWWARVAGEQPERTTNEPREARWAQVGSLGALPGANLALTGHPGRLDWVMTPTDNDRLVASIGDPADAIAVFRSGGDSWLKEEAPPTNRVAVGMTLVQEVETRDQGYEILDAFLPSVDLAPDSSDFFFQINRRRKRHSVAGDGRINRLSKWSVARVRGILFAADTGQTTETDEAYSCRLETDVNTVEGELSTTSGADLVALLDELVSASLEISDQGDLP